MYNTIEQPKTFEEAIGILLKDFPLTIMVSNIHTNKNYIHINHKDTDFYCYDEIDFDGDYTLRVVYDPFKQDSAFNHPEEYYCNKISDLVTILDFVKNYSELYK